MHNLISFEKKLTNKNKFNAFVSRNMDDWKKINIHWNDSSQSTFWGWNGFKLTFFHPTDTFFDIKVYNLIWINNEIQSAHEMQLELSQKTVSILSTKVHFNNINTLTSNNWNKCKVCGNKINKSIKFSIQKAMKSTII